MVLKGTAFHREGWGGGGGGGLSATEKGVQNLMGL